MNIKKIFKIRIFDVLKDFYNYISNYSYIIKTIKKIEKTKEWEQLGLRRDWIFRIYTVINIRLDDNELDDSGYDKDSIEQIERFKLLEEMRPIAFYLDNFNFREILKPITRKIQEENTNAYLLIFKPYFIDIGINLKYIFSRAIILSIIIYLMYKFNLIKLIEDVIGRI